MKIVTAKMTKTMTATAIMTRKEVVSADLAEAKAAVDAANEEVSADLDAGIALVGENYAAIKAAIEAKDVDMTGVKPSGYDEVIASIVAASGDAVAGDLLKNKTASTAAGVIMGTRPPSVVAWTGASGDAGQAWPSPRFVDNGDNTITDMLTGLMWLKTFSTSGRSYSQALAYPATISAGGYTDWRAPTIFELYLLVDLAFQTQVNFLPFQSGHPFLPARESIGKIWSKTVFAPLPSTTAWALNCEYQGVASWYTHATSGRATAVRGPIAL